MRNFYVKLIVVFLCSQSLLFAGREFTGRMYGDFEGCIQKFSQKFEQIFLERRELEPRERDRFLLLETNENDLTILHSAVYDGNLSLVENLIKRARACLSDDEFHYFINKPEKSCGWTPLHIAVAVKFVEIQATLIYAGASVLKKDSEGLIPSELAELITDFENFGNK